MKNTLRLILALLFIPIVSSVSAQDNPGIPTMPDCAEMAEVDPTVLIGGNNTISFGGVDFFEAYIEQHRGDPNISIDGEQMLGGSLVLEGCFVDETEFRLLGTLDNLDVLFIGIAVEPNFAEPTYGGLWYGWSGGYDPETEPDQKGFFFKLF